MRSATWIRLPIKNLLIHSNSSPVWRLTTKTQKTWQYVFHPKFPKYFSKDCFLLFRQKIMTICTIDVHSRDVVGKLINEKVTSSQAFTWLSQLRHRWDDDESHCFANICNAQFKYEYEYLGNTPRLVITPLTDRWVNVLNPSQTCSPIVLNDNKFFWVRIQVPEL